MAGPLTKMTKQGKLYVRPAQVEKAIQEAHELDQAALMARVEIRSSNSAGFISSECLLHLIREAIRKENLDKANRLLPWLLKRCEMNLRSKIPPDLVPDAEDLKDEILGRFAELIAEDLTDPKQRLDYYECHFNAAFRALRLPLVRRARREFEKHVSQSNAEMEEGTTEEEFLSELARKHLRGESVSPTQKRELAEAIEALPLNQRTAITLVYFFGFPEESDDPLVETAAKRCGVSGRTIRNRLAKALNTISTQLNSDGKRK